MAELADAPDLGSGGTPVQVQVLSPAPIENFSVKSGFLLGKLDFLFYFNYFIQLTGMIAFIQAWNNTTKSEIKIVYAKFTIDF